MTKPTYKNGIKFFEQILKNMHLESYSIVPNDEWLLYEIKFTTTSKKVLFTDEYIITIEFFNRVKPLLNPGDCIYLMGIWQHTTETANMAAQEYGIKIGNSTIISKLIYS